MPFCVQANYSVIVTEAAIKSNKLPSTESTMFAVRTKVFLILSLYVASVVCYEENCIDYEGKSVKHGTYYIPGPNVCSQCVCHNSEPLWCKFIFCDAPFFCRNITFGKRCCEFKCLDPQGPDNQYEARLKIVSKMEIKKSTASNISSLTVSTAITLAVFANTILGL